MVIGVLIMHDIWNPWHGCKKCSPGCQNCYMYYLDEQRGVGKSSDEVYITNNFDYPLRKDRHKQFKVKSGERIRVNMTSDTFLEEADEWRDDMWDIVRKRPDVIFWFLTKRPERMLNHLPFDWGDGWDNCFINVTCENQDMFDIRYRYLVDLPAKHKGLCLAPLISDIDISPILKSDCIDEVSVGGENYNNPRPCHFEWVKHIANTCAEYRVNFYWYETGMNFYIDNKRYFLPNRKAQSEFAYFSNLNHAYYDIEFDLRDIDGNLLTNAYKRHYNLNHCLFCSNQDMCNGCSKCGNCGSNYALVDKKMLHYYQNVIQADRLINHGNFDKTLYYNGLYNHLD